jgi:hypothetical protein
MATLAQDVARLTADNTTLTNKLTAIAADIAQLRQIIANPAPIDTTALEAALTSIETTIATPVDPAATPPLANKP